MRKLGDQWIENGRMYKAVAGNDCSKCVHFQRFDDINCGVRCGAVRRVISIEGCPIAHGCIVKALGPVNEDGCLAEERTGVYPEIANKFDLFAMDRVWVAEFQYSDSKGRYIQMQLRANSKQEAIDLWNRRNV